MSSQHKLNTKHWYQCTITSILYDRLSLYYLTNKNNLANDRELLHATDQKIARHRWSAWLV